MRPAEITKRSYVIWISLHDDVIKWKHFPRYWPFVRAIHRSPVNSPHKSQWRGALMFSLICAWINVWVNNREAGHLRAIAPIWRHCNGLRPCLVVKGPQLCKYEYAVYARRYGHSFLWRFFRDCGSPMDSRNKGPLTKKIYCRVLLCLIDHFDTNIGAWE